MRILAIDPGPTQSAYVIWDGSKIHEAEIVPTADLLNRDWEKAHTGQCLQSCHIEEIKSYGMAVGEEVFNTCRWIGRYQERWEKFRPGNEALLVPRKKVAMHLCHSMRAKDPNIRQALIDRFGPPGTKKQQGITYGLRKDLWSAFAIAVYAFDTHYNEVAA